MTVFLSILVTAAILFLIFFAACFIAFKKTFSKAKKSEKTEAEFYKKLNRLKYNNLAEKIKKDKKILEAVECKDVAIFSRDNLRLTGKLYLSDNKNANSSVILCHSHKSSGELDFGTAFKMYREMNYNILLIDQRAHGDSDGRYTTMGIMESYDIVNWCRWLEMCFGTECRTVVHGVSMGAFASLAAAANPEMPANVQCIIADSIYPLIYEYIYKKAKGSMAFLAKPAVTFVNLFYKNHIGFDMRDFSLYTVSKAVKIPVLFIHPESSASAPLLYAESLMKRIPAKTEIVKIKKAPCGICFAKDEKLCADSVKKFIGEA